MVTRLTTELIDHASLHQWLQCWLVQQCWLAGYRLRAHLFTMSFTYTTTNILCAATDVGMHGLLAQHRKTRPEIRYRFTDRFTPWWDHLVNHVLRRC